jgi:hypothetical protein
MCPRKSSASLNELFSQSKQLPMIGTNLPPQKGGSGFTDATMISIHCIRIYLDTTYRMTIDLRYFTSSVISQIDSLD